MSFYKRCVWGGIAASLLAIWFVIFQWDWVVYTEGAPTEERCYSPNHEYYVVRLKTLFSSSLDPGLRGTAKLYDKAGRLLYKSKTQLNSEFGPEWFEEIGRHHSSVYFLGNPDDNEPDGGWGYDLPSSPGDRNSGISRVCF